MNPKLILVSSLSLIRIPLALLFFYFLYYKNLASAFTVLIISALSDKLDGSLARRLGLGANLWGKIFDPLGDRIFMVISFMALAIVDLPIKPTKLVIYLTLGQDLLLAPLGIYAFFKKRRVFTSPLGKVATFYQFIFLILVSGLNLYQMGDFPLIYFEIPLFFLNLFSAAHHIYFWLHDRQKVVS